MMAPGVNAATRRGLLHSGGAGDAKDGERLLNSLDRHDPSCARRLFSFLPEIKMCSALQGGGVKVGFWDA